MAGMNELNRRRLANGMTSPPYIGSQAKLILIPAALHASVCYLSITIRSHASAVSVVQIFRFHTSRELGDVHKVSHAIFGQF